MEEYQKLIEMAEKVLPKVHTINLALSRIDPGREIYMLCIDLEAERPCHAGLLNQAGMAFHMTPSRQKFNEKRKEGDLFIFQEEFFAWFGLGGFKAPEPLFSVFWGNKSFDYCFAAPGAFGQTSFYFKAEVIKNHWLAVEQRINSLQQRYRDVLKQPTNQ